MSALAKVRSRRKTVFVTRKSSSEDEPAIIEDETNGSFTSTGNLEMSRAAPTGARIGGGRLKKTKIPFDPSHSSVPRRRQTMCETQPDPQVKAAKKQKLSPTFLDTNMPFCIRCKTHANRKFISCKCCTTVKIHLDCLKADCSHFSDAEENHWQCDSCQSCLTCYESSIIEPLIKCYSCFSYYHMSCHETASSRVKWYTLKVVPKDRFRCSQCEAYKATIRKISEQRSLLDKTKIGLNRSTSPPDTGFAISPEFLVPKSPRPSFETPKIESTPSYAMVGSKSEKTSVLVSSTQSFNNQTLKNDTRHTTSILKSFSAIGRPRIKPKRVHTGFVIKPKLNPAVPNNVALVEKPKKDLKYLTPTSETGINGIPKSDTSLLNTLPATNNGNGSCVVTNGFVSQLDTGDFAGFDEADVKRPVLNSSPACEMESQTGKDKGKVESVTNKMESIRLTNGTSSPPKPLTFSSEEDDKGLGWTPFGNVSGTVPDPSEWSAQDVFDYFCESFPVASRALLEQEVDGSALLLVKRRDILNLVGYQVEFPDRQPRKITLGTALKIYAHVVRLQTRSNDVRLSWMNIDKD